ncbi:pyroglutamyl-peptidase I [Actomonas aquatica]|uniref:Pyroglutamyl-peptidase I n=1 Tax=Actomonas aquatica TaxID=2866162 RepID=A0ABZ1CBM6_9BACT|nr:pyroglutamyl-peptidase I [Opitutus sp. WL0086]WRQ89081.1 pyroglutamyl-peptidase I [Opitutus sp. WL0086]
MSKNPAPSARTVLVTGFEPFGGERSNPSAFIAGALDGRELAGHRVTGVVLPVVFGASLRALDDAIERVQPALVVCLGVAGNRRHITPERVAINLDDARIPDNAGNLPIEQPVVAGGPVAYWSTLPVRRMEAALAAADVPVKLSETAGTYVCNHLFYGLMHRLAQRPGVRGGFVHVPRPRAGLSRAKMADGLVAAIAAALGETD